ncbi:hypothetical protein CEP51_013426 [Fusarium floridanum]|uniref:Heterokaryon incompatibility domain-containing protein n=1 Tax=Fusarium floridanum TaxID=1325733 RepID=A0A428QBZ7_9HYPO|nr:hypothetical protein CEP51_013426 [Fusarium floridanum]
MPAPKHAPYVALSYVWGYHQTAKSTLMSGGNTSIDGMASLPITIADAIRVTIKLGFRYLWVDLYCIDQDNETDGDHHMAQMNMIYHNAELTIIAAARNSAEYGLPGVEYRPRSIRQFAKVGNIEIVPTMRHPHAAIQTSKWSKRAWTFQEGILSRRRLVFTDDQMYFECDGMNCHESVTNVPERNDHWTAFEYCKQIKSSLDELHAPNKLEFDRTLRAGILGWNNKQHFGQPNRSGSHAAFVRFLEMAQVYSAKELWEPSDALRAFDGITSKFEALPDRIDQIWGIPFYRDEAKTLEETFVAGLAWNHAGRAGYDIERLPQPRFICPTWSWMNWDGEAEYGEYDLYKGGYKSAFKSAVASVVLYACDGSLLTLSEYRQKLQSGISRSDIPKTVRIHAWVLPASAFAVEGSVLTLFRKPTNIHVSTADYPERPSLLDLTQEDTKFTKHWKCIYLGSVENKKICLVIRWWSIGWERIALLFTWGNEVDEWCQYMPRRALHLI